MIYCCKDCFYRIYELNTRPHHHQLNKDEYQDEDESIADVVVAAVEPLAAPQSSSTSLSSSSSSSFLKLVDKRQINSNINLNRALLIKNKSTSVEIRSIYIKNRSIMDVRKMVDWHELYPTRYSSESDANISLCKYFNEYW